MKIVAIVPVKLNSERLVNKNIKPFTNGKPLIHYVLTTLLKVPSIDEVYVYCSDPEIKKYLPEGVLYKKRSVQLDKNETKMNEVIDAFMKEVTAEMYVLSHVTSPFISSESIELGIQKVRTEKFDSALAVHKMQDFIWHDGKPFNYSTAAIPRTQDLEPLFVETSGFYIFKQIVFKQLHSRIGKNPYLVEVSQIEATDIDTRADFEIADAIFNYQRQKLMI